MKNKFKNKFREIKKIRTIHTHDHGDHEIVEYRMEPFTGNEISETEEKSKKAPKIHHVLRSRMINIPEVIEKATGINILGRVIKSVIFTTDIAIIKNSNADAVMAVYPFTPQLSITNAILNNSSVPVFVGIGGGQTSGIRSKNIGLQAELLGAYGLVVNSPMSVETISEINELVDIPVIVTVVSEKDNYLEKINYGAQILNVSAGAKTAEVVKNIRKKIGQDFPIIATGGPTDETILETIEAGANAITYTPPTSAEIFSSVMEDYRNL